MPKGPGNLKTQFIKGLALGTPFAVSSVKLRHYGELTNNLALRVNLRRNVNQKFNAGAVGLIGLFF